MKKLAERKLDLVYIDKDGRLHQIDEVDSAELARGLEKISKEIATRLRLQKEQR